MIDRQQMNTTVHKIDAAHIRVLNADGGSV